MANTVLVSAMLPFARRNTSTPEADLHALVVHFANVPLLNNAGSLWPMRSDAAACCLVGTALKTERVSTVTSHRHEVPRLVHALSPPQLAAAAGDEAYGCGAGCTQGGRGGRRATGSRRGNAEQGEG